MMHRALHRRSLRVIALASSAIPLPALAATKTWQAGSGTWSTAGNWNPASIPGASDEVILSNGDAVSRVLTYNYAGTNLTLSSLLIDQTGAGTNRLTQGDFRLSAVTENIGATGRGTFSQTGGTNIVTTLNLSVGSNSSGLYELSGTGFLTATQEIVGRDGAGTFNQTGGRHVVGSSGTVSLALGLLSNGNGTFNLSGGTLQSDFGVIGQRGSGSFVQSGGSHTVSGRLSIIPAAGRTGTYSLSGPSTLNADTLLVGDDMGTANFIQTGGQLFVMNPKDSITVGYTGGAGTFFLSGGTVTTAVETVGHSNAGEFRHSGGLNDIANSLYLARNPGAVGNYYLSDAGVLRVTNLFVGPGYGNFNQSGGTAHAQAIAIGDPASDAQSFYALSGGLLDAGAVTIQKNGDFSFTGGTLTFTSLTNNGRLSFASNASVAGDLFLANGSTSVLNASLTTSASITLQSTTLAGGGAIDLAATATLGGRGDVFPSIKNAGTIRAANGNLVLNGPLVNSGLLANAAGSSLFVSSTSVAHTGNLSVASAGAIVFSTPITNGNARTTTMRGGTLATPTLTNAAGGNINGYGTVAGNLVNNGAVDLSGPTIFQGHFTNNASVAIRNDQLLVVGTMVNNGTLTTSAGGKIVIEGNTTPAAPLPAAPLPSSPVAGGITGAGRLSVGAGGTVLTSFVRQDAVDLTGDAAGNAPGILTLRSVSEGGGNSVLHSLTIQTDGGGNPLGTLDVADSALVIDYSGASPRSSVGAMIRAGYHNGDWRGNGITSSIAVRTGDAIGYVESGDRFGPAGGTFLGEPVDGTALLIRYTKPGDANLDGTVDFDDLVALAQHYNTTGGGAFWSNGDFNYDGNVDFNDLVKLAQNYNTSVAPAPATLASVPEPSNLLALCVLCGPRRRRRTH